MENNKIDEILEKYRQKSISTTTEELKNELIDCEYFDLIFWREQLGEFELTTEQRLILAESDQRIANKMTIKLLEDYAIERQDLPITEWWGK